MRDSAGAAVLRTRPVMVSCGQDDPFAPQVASFRTELGDPPGGIGPGCPDDSYWRRQIPADLAFVGAQLA